MDEISIIDPVVGDEELENVEAVLESGYMTQGPYAEEFEERVAERSGADHGITATSCTTGLELVLEAGDIGPGDEVIVPDFTYPATANVVERLGADPVLVDVDRRTYNIDPEAVVEAVTDDTAALMPISFGGQPLEPEPLRAVADEHGIPIYEDAAWGFGAAWDGEPVGSQFEASIFSFHPRKAITTGEGGVIVTDDDELATTIREIKNFGLDHSGGDAGFVRANATNYRLSDILAAVGVAQLDKCDDIYDRRRELAARYDDLLDSVDGVRAPYTPDEATHTYGSYCVYVEAGDETTRDAVIDRLGDDGIETSLGTYALHQTPAFEAATRGTDLDTSRDLYHNLLSLPVVHEMTAEDQKRVVEELAAAIADLA
jgi:dTDP-4-amino-4,6-dideoxygalactose transaminase